MNRKLKKVLSTVGQTNKPKISNVHSRDQLGRGRCAKCGNPHSEACRSIGSECFSCGQVGHMSKDVDVEYFCEVSKVMDSFDILLFYYKGTLCIKVFNVHSLIFFVCFHDPFIYGMCTRDR